MKVQTDGERQAAADTLKEVTRKLEEALRLSQEREEQRGVRVQTGTCGGKDDLVRG